MDYQGNIIRPPAEANSILLQVTVGCSHNRCLFCALYKDERFQIKSEATINKDLEFAAENFKNKKRIFLCGGDALILPFDQLISLLKKIKTHLPWIKRAGLYANAKSIRSKSDPQLRLLRNEGLKIIYMGLESGDEQTLKRVNKGVNVNEQIIQARRIIAAGLKLSCTIILGLAGRERSQQHAVETGKALSAINPDYIGALSLMLSPEIELYQSYQENKFTLPGPQMMLEELKIILENTCIDSGIFSANHASNFLPLQIRLPGGKEEAIHKIEQALAGKISLKPQWMRRL